jgi:Domain of unknown function (DUF3471)
MKKILLFLLLANFALISELSAQTLPSSTTDTLSYKEYVGKYKLKDAPIEDLIVTIQNGKLMGEAVGQGSAQLLATNQADVFDVVGYDGKLVFIRDENKVVTKLKLSVQGQTMEGEKQQ